MSSVGGHASHDGVVTLITGELVEPARSACDTPTHAPPVRNPVEVLEEIAIIKLMAGPHALVISVAHSNGQAWLTVRLSGDMPMEPGDAHEPPHHATITPGPWNDLQGDAIAAPKGEKLMSVTMIASMSVPMVASILHSLATIWARWITLVIAVVEVHAEVARLAAASASWSTGPRGFWGDHSGTMVRRDLG